MLAAGTGLAAAAWALHVTGASPTDAGPPAAPVPHATLQDFPKVPYDGTYTFVRVRFNTGGGRNFSRGFGRGGGPGWAHDYPYADDNFIKILDEVTSLKTIEPSFGIHFWNQYESRPPSKPPVATR